MRRLLIGTAAIGGVLVAARVLAPKLHARMLAACQRMFEHLPEDFPPKQMMGGIEEIRANTARTLELLEERTQAEAKTQEELVWMSAEERGRCLPKKPPAGCRG
jgi:hypothetical protein